MFAASPGRGWGEPGYHGGDPQAVGDPGGPHLRKAGQLGARGSCFLRRRGGRVEVSGRKGQLAAPVAVGWRAVRARGSHGGRDISGSCSFRTGWGSAAWRRSRCSEGAGERGGEGGVWLSVSSALRLRLLPQTTARSRSPRARARTPLVLRSEVLAPPSSARKLPGIVCPRLDGAGRPGRWPWQRPGGRSLPPTRRTRAQADPGLRAARWGAACLGGQ